MLIKHELWKVLLWKYVAHIIVAAPAGGKGNHQILIKEKLENSDRVPCHSKIF